MSKTNKYFHPLQSKKFRAGMERIRKNEIIKVLDAAREEFDKVPDIAPDIFDLMFAPIDYSKISNEEIDKAIEWYKNT